MAGVSVEKVIEEFNSKRDLRLKAELMKVESYRLTVTFCTKGNHNNSNFDEDIVEFGNILSSHSGTDYDLVRLFRLGDGRFVGVFVPDGDRMKEVVDFGFDPFDTLL